MPDSGFNLPKSLKVVLKLGFNMLMVVFALYFLSGFADSIKASRAINNRFNAVQIQKGKVGTKTVINLPHLGYWPKTKYGINNGLDDIGNNPDVWPNAGYKMNFGVRGVRLKD
nr:DUF6056 family protein [Liquorilactobacillus uvarum]